MPIIQDTTGQAIAQAIAQGQRFAEVGPAIDNLYGQLETMLGNPSDDAMWAYATGQAEADRASYIEDDSTDEAMMAYIRGGN